MISTGRQIRKGRQLAGMSQADLAVAADVALGLVLRVELVDWCPMITRRDAIVIQGALEAAGMAFSPENGGSAGVRLRNVEL